MLTSDESGDETDDEEDPESQSVDLSRRLEMASLHHDPAHESYVIFDGDLMGIFTLR